MPAATPAAAPADNACMAIADAKFQQWRQERLLIQEAKTFADNSTKNDEMILTSNTAYWNRLGVWETGNITRGERAARSPDRILRIMGLIDCAKGGSDQTMGQPATLYTYHYVPDRNGFSAEGRIWISDATGLPRRRRQTRVSRQPFRPRIDIMRT
jgi:hypothetical protein